MQETVTQEPLAQPPVTQARVIRPASGSDVGLTPENTKSVEVYGFVGWITSFVAYITYLLWAFLPESFLQRVGITYYPSKYWATALPAYFCVLVMFAGIFYVGINFYNTPPLASFVTLRDNHSRNLESAESHLDDTPGGTSEIADLPVTTINRILFREQRQGGLRGNRFRGSTNALSPSSWQPPLSPSSLSPEPDAHKDLEPPKLSKAVPGSLLRSISRSSNLGK